MKLKEKKKKRTNQQEKELKKIEINCS